MFSAAINFKNIVSKHWKVREDCFTINDGDKNTIRQNFLECVVKSNDMIRYLMFSCGSSLNQDLKILQQFEASSNAGLMDIHS